jgi:hypothetical protein
MHVVFHGEFGCVSDIVVVILQVFNMPQQVPFDEITPGSTLAICGFTGTFPVRFLGVLALVEYDDPPADIVAAEINYSLLYFITTAL